MAWAPAARPVMPRREAALAVDDRRPGVSTAENLRDVFAGSDGLVAARLEPLAVPPIVGAGIVNGVVGSRDVEAVSELLQ